VQCVLCTVYLLTLQLPPQQVNGQGARTQSDEAKRLEDSQREQRRLAVRVQMVR
jgi:hypothetical protein